MGAVTIVYGNNVFEMVRQLMESTGALDSIDSRSKILLKPNLVVSRKDWAGIDTDPRVVEALVVLLKEKGINNIAIGDGSGMGQSATKAFNICGYDKIAGRHGVRLVDLEKDRFVSKPVGMEGPFKTLEIAETVIASNFIINVPVMKAHSQTMITCSLKNLKGTMPRSMKTAFHGVDLHRAIAQLNSVIAPDLIVVDGLKGDLYSETGSNPVAMDRLLTGTNPVEVDSVVADMLGYSPKDVRHIVYSAQAGRGTCDLEEIKVVSLNRPSEVVRFNPPTHYSRRFPCSISAEGACCVCMGNFIYALERLNEKRLLNRNLHFAVGQNPAAATSGEILTIAVGACAAAGNIPSDVQIPTCPPTAASICKVVEYIDKQLGI